MGHPIPLAYKSIVDFLRTVDLYAKYCAYTQFIYEGMVLSYLPDELWSHVIQFCDDNVTLCTVRTVCKGWERSVNTQQLIQLFATNLCGLRFLFERIWLLKLYSRADGLFSVPTVDQRMYLYTAVYTSLCKRPTINAIDVLRFAIDLKDELFYRYQRTDHREIVTLLTNIFKYMERKLERTDMPQPVRDLLATTRLNGLFDGLSTQVTRKRRRDHI